MLVEKSTRESLRAQQHNPFQTVRHDVREEITSISNETRKDCLKLLEHLK